MTKPRVTTTKTVTRVLLAGLVVASVVHGLVFHSVWTISILGTVLVMISLWRLSYRPVADATIRYVVPELQRVNDRATRQQLSARIRCIVRQSEWYGGVLVWGALGPAAVYTLLVRSYYAKLDMKVVFLGGVFLGLLLCPVGCYTKLRWDHVTCPRFMYQLL